MTFCRSKAAKRRENKQEGFLLVTLLQSVLCVMMISGAFILSSVMGLTEVKAALSSMMTRENEAVAVFAPQVSEKSEQIRDILRLILQRVFDKEEGRGGSQPNEGGGIPNNVTTNAPLISTPMQMPVEGWISSSFGERIHPISQKRDWHTGVDIAAPMGSRIAAAWPGVVKTVGSDDIYGNYILIEHGNFSTRYCHCSKTAAKEGEHLRAGETVAFVGSSGVSTGPHLHFEIILDGKKADPMSEAPVWRAL